VYQYCPVFRSPRLTKGQNNAIGADGTGVHGGVVQSIEEKLNKPLQRLICLLHMTELCERGI
jgi:hypothetical protein